MPDLRANPFMDLYFCLTAQHRPELILLALAAAVLGGTTGMLALRRARAETGRMRHAWAVAAGLALGGGGWTAHYIALMGYLAGAPVGFFLGATLGSLALITLAGITAAILLLRLPTRGGVIVAGLFFGGGLAAMHYIGMAALQVPVTLRWDADFVAASVAVAIMFSYPALGLGRFGTGKVTGAAAVACFSLLVLLTHMTGMTALRLVPGHSSASGLVIPPALLAAWIGAVTLALFAVGLTITVTNRRARAAIKRSEQQFSILVNGISDYAIFMVDVEGRVSQWNAGAQRLTGFSSEDVIGVPFSRLVAKQERAAGLPEKALEIAASEGSFKGIASTLRSDGTCFQAEGSIQKLCNEDGVHIGYAVITHDVTGAQQAQALIEETSQRLDTALENMHDGLCLFDADERLVLYNQRFYDMWGLGGGPCTPGATLERLVAAGFLNRGGPNPAAECLREFRRTLGDIRVGRAGAPLIAELADNRVVAIASNSLPDGGWVTSCTDITELRRSEAKVAHMAMHDPLTGLPNRARHCRWLDHEIELAAQQGHQVAVIAIDLDRFKDINEVHGHAAGDQLLQTLGERLAAGSREGETIARLGGDEFAAAKRFTREAELKEFIVRLHECIGTPVAHCGQRLGVEASMGIALLPQDGWDREALLNNASLALNRAKTTIGRRLCFFDPDMDEKARLRRQLTNDLRRAVAQHQLELLYQPQIALATGATCGYEALLRWNHPQRGVVPPSEFIPLAEESGAILGIGEWVLREACAEARWWPEGQKVAVNLSPVQFLQDGLVARVQAILVETGVSPRQLELEITETAIISDKARALHCLRQFKAMGISVAIDDFGTGHSSLDTLHSFPFSKIKIDKSFLMRADASPQALAIIRTILALGRSLGVPVLAEGVETEGQCAILRHEGCEEAQGFLFGRPMAAPSRKLRLAAGS